MKTLVLLTAVLFGTSAYACEPLSVEQQNAVSNEVGFEAQEMLHKQYSSEFRVEQVALMQEEASLAGSDCKQVVYSANFELMLRTKELACRYQGKLNNAAGSLQVDESSVQKECIPVSALPKRNR